MKSFNVYLLLFFALVLSQCASKGVGQEPIGEGQWEVRAWDGFACGPDVSDSECKTILEPTLASHSEKVCAGKPDDVKNCQITGGASGRRLKCEVICK